MIKPFNQLPVYEPDAKISIPINDFIELQDFLNIFSEPFRIIQSAYFGAIREGTIKFKYIEEGGIEITEDEARRRLAEHQNSLTKPVIEKDPE